MRLWSLLLAALIAVSMAIAPVAMPRAAASGSDGAATLSAGHAHGSHGQKMTDHGHGHASMAHHQAEDAPDCEGSEPGSHGFDGANCCSMGACHALQASLPESISLPLPSATAVGLSGDEQVEGIAAGRLDRPPRTV